MKSQFYERQLLSINEAIMALTLQLMELTRRKTELERKTRFVQINTGRRDDNGYSSIQG